MRFAPLVLVMFAAGSTACGGAVMTAPKTAAPVLLGPVDRVGGHRAGPDAADAPTVGASTGDGFAILDAGPYIYMQRYNTGSLPATNALLDATEARADRDVHVTSLKSGGWGFVAGGVAWQDNATLRGTVVKVER